MFNDDVTFRVSGQVQKHSVRIRALENPNSYVEHVRDSSKVNVFCAISHEMVYGPFFLIEATVTDNSYLDILQLWLLPQLEEDIESLIFQQDAAPSHYYLDVRKDLNTRFRRRWIGRAGREDFECLPWPPRSLTAHLVIFYSGICKTASVSTTLTTYHRGSLCRHHRGHCTSKCSKLQRVWQEIGYRINVCPVSQGAPIEHL